MNQIEKAEFTRRNAADFERGWILKHGVSNLHSLSMVLRRQKALSFSAVNPSLSGAGIKDARPGMWCLAWVEPTPEPTFWWAGIAEYALGTVLTSPVATATEAVVPTLKRWGVADVRFRVGVGTPVSLNPWISAPPPERGADGRSVYFVQAGSGGLVKIGVARDVRGRVSSLQTGSPVPLRLLASIPDVGAEAEARLHVRFAHLRSHGEWFNPGTDLLAYIAEHAVPA